MSELYIDVILLIFEKIEFPYILDFIFINKKIMEHFFKINKYQNLIRLTEHKCDVESKIKSVHFIKMWYNRFIKRTTESILNIDDDITLTYIQKNDPYGKRKNFINYSKEFEILKNERRVKTIHVFEFTDGKIFKYIHNNGKEVFETFDWLFYDFLPKNHNSRIDGNTIFNKL